VLAFVIVVGGAIAYGLAGGSNSTDPNGSAARSSVGSSGGSTLAPLARALLMQGLLEPVARAPLVASTVEVAQAGNQRYDGHWLGSWWRPNEGPFWSAGPSSGYGYIGRPHSLLFCIALRAWPRFSLQEPAMSGRAPQGTRLGP